MRPRRSKPSGSRSLPHRETPTHRLGLTAEEEHTFYADPANQVPKGPSVRRRRRLSEPVPVRFPETLLAEVKRATAAAAIIDLYDFTLAGLSIFPTECVAVVDQCG